MSFADFLKPCEKRGLMAILEPDIPFIKLLLDNKVRISLVFELRDNEKDPEKLEYLFAPEKEDKVVCMMYSGTRGEDPLKLYGNKHTFEKFSELVNEELRLGGDDIYYRRLIVAYPSNWYPCFETERDERIEDLKSIIQVLKADKETLASIAVHLKMISKQEQEPKETISNMDLKRKLLFD